MTSPTLRSDRLYLGDNGRVLCGALRCAGATAHFSGRDLSGQRVVPVTATQATQHGLQCEGCGMVPKMVVIA